jgi:hypothetical protein
MRQRLTPHLTYANVMVTTLAFIVLGGGAYAATGGNFILGQSNSASARTTLSAPIANRALQVTNTSTGTGATALGLNVASGHPPFTVNSGTKVANLNADRLDGIDSTGFVADSSLRRVGPVTFTPAVGTGTALEIATIDNLSFYGSCIRDLGGSDVVRTLIYSADDHSTYASLTQAAAGGTWGDGDLNPGEEGSVANIQVPTGTANFNPITGSAVDANGEEVTFNLYQAMNTRNHPGQCMFGGSFVVN